MPLFDTYIFVDWSAKHGLLPREPAADGIWIGECTLGTSCNPTTTYCRSRHDAISQVLSRLVDHLKQQRRVLVGFDFPYGYPRGFCRALGLDSGDQAAWLVIWTKLSSRIEDTNSNRNNRFTVANDLNKIANLGVPGPFWGYPRNRATPNLQPTSPGFPFPATNGVILPRLRIAETRLRGVQEAWKLFGSGSVGSQALVGIPYLDDVRQHEALRQHTQVWPFETGFSSTPAPKHEPCILHAEIWPGVVKQETDRLMGVDSNLIKDQAQVMALCLWASQLDHQGELQTLFDKPAA
jgi:hypothetical protein